MPPIMIVRSGVTVPAADPAVQPPALAPGAPGPVALFAQPARASEPTTVATRASAFHGEVDIVISFRSRGGGMQGRAGVSDGGHVRGARRWPPAQDAFLEQGDEGLGSQSD